MLTIKAVATVALLLGLAMGVSAQLLLGVQTGSASAQGSALNAGDIVLRLSGTCGEGFTEATDLNGRFPLGTLAANGDLNGTGGVDTITPAGFAVSEAATVASVDALCSPEGSGGGSEVSPGVGYFPCTPAGTNSAPTFTGTALATHSHELPFQKVAGGTGVLRMIASSVFGVGTSRAAESQSAAPAANTTSAAVLKDQPLSAGTPAGTVSAPAFTGTGATLTHTVTQPSAHTVTQPTFTGTPATLTGSVAAPTFTGNQVDNRPAFRRVIFCVKS